MSDTLKVTGIILRRTNYKEADRILSVLTREHGQLAVIARGVRREQSRLAGGIELFATCELSLVKSAMNLQGMWTLTGARLMHFYDYIMTDYDRLQFGYDAIKRVSKLADAIDSPELYDVLLGVIELLNKSTVDLRITKAWFYLKLARLSGMELNLLTDSNGMQLVEGASYDYNKADGVFVFNSQGQYNTAVLKLLRVLLANDATVAARLSGIDDAVLSNAVYLAATAAQV